MSKFYVIGNPIKQSKSPLLFNYIFKKLNIQQSYTGHYIDKASNLSNFIDSCKKNNTIGINVTMPYKKSICKFATQYDQTVEITKTSNCLHFKNNDIIAYNNDSYGFSKLAEFNNINFSKSNNIIIGNGGAARSIVLSLIESKAKAIYILARNQEKTDRLISDFSIIKNITILSELSQNSILTNCNLINCSPIGMLKKTNTDILNFIPRINYHSVIDINYNVNHNYFNFKAQNKIIGDIMFIFQALKALDIWFESNISDKLSYKELEKIVC